MEERRNSPILLQDIGLEVVQREEVSAGGFRHEGVSAAVGGGALEGPQEGGVPATSAW